MSTRSRNRSAQQAAEITKIDTGNESPADVIQRAEADPEFRAQITSRFDGKRLFPENPDAATPVSINFPDGDSLTMWCKPMLVGDIRKLARAQRSNDFDAIIVTLKELITDWDAYENGEKLDIQDDAVWDAMDTSVLTLIASAVGKSA